MVTYPKRGENGKQERKREGEKRECELKGGEER